MGFLSGLIYTSSFKVAPCFIQVSCSPLGACCCMLIKKSSSVSCVKYRPAACLAALSAKAFPFEMSSVLFVCASHLHIANLLGNCIASSSSCNNFFTSPSLSVCGCVCVCKRQTDRESDFYPCCSPV